MFEKKKRNLIGVDIGSNTIKIVEISKKNDQFFLEKIAYQELTEDVIVDGKIIDFAEVVNALTSAFKSGKFVHKNVICSIKGNEVMSKRIEIDLSGVENFEESFRWEANQYIEFDAVNINIDYQRLQENRKTGLTPVIIAVSKKDIINDIKFVFDSAKLKLDIVDLEVFALANLFTHVYKEFTDASVIVDIGHEKTHVVFIEDKEYKFSYDIDYGIKSCITQFVQSFDMTYDEALNAIKNKIEIENNSSYLSTVEMFIGILVGEISKVINSIEKESAAEYKNCFVCGDGINLYNLQTELSSKLEMNISAFDPFNNMTHNKRIDEDLVKNRLYSFNVAAGLAIRFGEER